MIIMSLSPSRENNYQGCQQNYFIENCLGWRSPGNKKADIGSIFHSVMEFIANWQLAKQQGKEIDHKHGKITSQELDISSVCKNVYEHEIKEYDHDWDEPTFFKKNDPKDLRDLPNLDVIKQWVNETLGFNNGALDPRNLKIIEPEKRFRLPIDQPWAKYKFKFQGEEIVGDLALNGIIDLVYEVDEDTIGILDYKTGQAKNWNTNEKKDYNSLYTDFQLRFYDYAARKIFTDKKHFLTTIWFIRDGGPFSYSFEDKHMEETEAHIKKTFQSIKRNRVPRLNKSWKCKWCNQYKTTFENPMLEFRQGQFTQVGEPMSKCQQIQYETQKHGIDYVTDKYTKEKV